MAKADEYLQNVLGPLYEEGKITAFLKSGPEMVEWVEANSKARFKPVSLPDYHVSTQGASIGRTLLTKEFNGRELGHLIKDIRYPIQGYSAFVTLSMLTNPLGSLANLAYAVRVMSRYVFDLIRWGKGTAMANGNALVGRLLASLQIEGAQVWNMATALKAVIEEGHVSGLKVLRNGQKMSIYARKGVVLASGGFVRSPEAQQYLPHEWCASPQGNIGDGKRIGVQSGGALPSKHPMNAIFAPTSLLNVPGQPIRRFPHFAIDRSKPGSIIVDLDGKRFENESAPYQEFVASMHDKGIKKAFYIGDHTHTVKPGYNEPG